MRRSVLHLSLTCGLLAFASSTHAQVVSPTWVSLDPLAGPGSPPTVVVNAALSNTQHTVVDIAIPGFYSQSVIKVGSGTFKALSLPRRSPLETLQVPGKPALPVINMMLGIPTDAAGIVLGGVDVQATSTLTGYGDTIPDQPDADEIEDQPLTQPPFEFDRTFYATSADYPTVDAQTTAAPGAMGDVRVQSVGICPFKLNPATGQLTVRTHMRLTFAHAGVPSAPIELTKRGMRNLAPIVPNLPANPSVWVVNTQTYNGAYLFIVAPDKVDDIEPLVQQKKERGFKVTVATTANIDLAPAGITYSDIETAINGWYLQNSYSDRYVLLVGDHEVLPIGQSPLFPLIPWKSDYYYGCVGNDYYVDVNLGRITYSDGNPTPAVADLAEIVDRIIAYEDHPLSSNYYNEVLLTAHREVDAGFVKNMKIIEATPYAYPPNFTHLWGTEANGTTANAFAEINENKHLIYYRGHGGVTRWHEWDFTGQHLHQDDIPYDYQPQNPNLSPIFINSACANGAFHAIDVDSICEELMENSNGAIATYGATSSSRRDINDLFTFNFFELLYTYEVCNLSLLCNLSQLFAYQAVEWDGGSIDADRFKNMSQYVFFGDPEMKMYRTNPDPLYCPGLPSSVGFGPQSLAVHVQTSSGQALPGALVAIFKDGEFDTNTYANASGDVVLAINPTNAGRISVRAYSDDLNKAAFRAEIVVRCPADFNGSGSPTVQDLFDFLAAYFSSDPRADINRSGTISVQDIFDFLAAYFAGCA